MLTIEDYRNTIGDKLKDLDVAVVVINAGYVFNGPLNDLRDHEVENHINLNIIHVAYTTKVLLKQLVDRYK